MVGNDHEGALQTLDLIAQKIPLKNAGGKHSGDRLGNPVV